MTLTAHPSNSAHYICFQCISDPVLREQIRAVGRRRVCSYCEHSRKAVSLESLAEHVDEIYHLLVRVGEEYPVVHDDSDRVHWVNEGDSPVEIMAEILECDTRDIASDVVSHLAKKYAWDVGHDGDFDWFDDTSEIYVIEIPRDPEFKDTWSSYCNSIKHDRRFFNKNAASLLGEILEPILRGEWPRSGSAIRTIEPSGPDSFVYRGRLANGVEARKAIYRSPIRQLSAPPPELNSAGRMNPAGISVFYGSFDKRTCVAELRVPVGGEAIVGKFEVIRPLRVLDLTVLESASFRLSFFEDNFLKKYAYNEFLRGFHAEIRKPVVPGREALEYLPTQFIAEYLWATANPPLDGLIYGSSQLSAGANNIVIFPHACEVQGYSEEVPIDIKDVTSSGDDDDESEVVFTSGSDTTANIRPLFYGDTQPGLRLLTNEISISRVAAISYDVEERRVNQHELQSIDAEALGGGLSDLPF